MKIKTVLCLILMAIVTAGCATLQTAATPTSVLLTNTLVPTQTATATATITPTPTRTATPTPMPIPEEFTLRPQWQVGETRRFQRITTRSDRYYGQTPKTNSAIDTIAINVLEVNDKGYVLEWRLEGVDAFDVEEVANADMEALLMDMKESIKGMRIEYEVDTLGQIVQLTNLDEIREAYETIHEAIISGFEGMGIGQELIDMMLMMWDQFLSDEMLEAIALEELGNYHLFYGQNLKTKSPTTYLYSGEKLNEEDVLTFEIVFKVLEYDLENDQVQMHGFAMLEGEQLEKFVQAYMDMILSTSVTAEMELDEETIEEITTMVEAAVYTVEVDLTAEISTGWITAHKMTTQIEMEPITMIETVNIRMMDE